MTTATEVLMTRAFRNLLLCGVIAAATGVGGIAVAQTNAAPGTGVLTLPPLGTPGTGTGTGTGGAGNARLGGSVGGVPGMGNVAGPSSNGTLLPGGGMTEPQSATGSGRAATRR
jgi:hypothetical protein